MLAYGSFVAQAPSDRLEAATATKIDFLNMFLPFLTGPSAHGQNNLQAANSFRPRAVVHLPFIRWSRLRLFAAMLRLRR